MKVLGDVRNARRPVGLERMGMGEVVRPGHMGLLGHGTNLLF